MGRQTLNDTGERSARKALHDRLEREAMGDDAYRKYVISPVDRTFYIVFGLIMVAAIVVVFALP